MLNTNVQPIDTTSVRIEQQGTLRDLANEAVIVCAGGELPMPLLRSFGIEFETKFGSR